MEWIYVVASVTPEPSTLPPQCVADGWQSWWCQNGGTTVYWPDRQYCGCVCAPGFTNYYCDGKYCSLNMENLGCVLCLYVSYYKIIGGRDTVTITFIKDHFSFHTIIFSKITTSKIRHYLTQCDGPSPVFQEVTKTAWLSFLFQVYWKIPFLVLWRPYQRNVHSGTTPGACTVAT